MKKIYEYEDIQPLLEKLLQDKESNEIEFKSAAGGFPHSFWETYSSFANTNGGAIIFGIREKDGEFVLDGLTEEQVKKYQKDFFSNMHSKQQVNIPLLTENDVQIVSFKRNFLLFFYITRVDRNLRPIYCGLDPYTGTYRRDLDGDYHCSREEVNSMFADANLASPVDGRILKNFNKKDLDTDSIKQYRQRFVQANPDHVWNALSEDKFLEKLNVFRRDRETGKLGLTYAGLLMFGTYSAIMDENPNFFPDYQEIQEIQERWVNRVYPDGNWESNLFQFYNKVLPILQNFLPKPFKLKENQRKNETSAHIAIREAFVNALVHADYTENASLNIYKYPNRIVFSNPGIMLISLKQYYQGGESVCRNKYLQTMFTFLGSAEKAGSGADKIIHGWEEQNWKRPYIIEKSRPNKVILTMSMESLLDENVKEDLLRYFGKKINKLSRDQLLTLALTYSEKEITNERLQYTLDIHRADITHMLKDMCHEKLLEAFGHGRGTRYHIYGTNIATSEKSIATSKKWYKSNELKKLIVKICSDWKTVEEIAVSVERDKGYIRNKILPQMENVLERMYKDIPNHPGQKYKAKQQKNNLQRKN